MRHKHKFAVIGLGLFGSAIARKLSAKGAEVIAIDNDENNVENIKDDVAQAVTLDATDKKALLSQGVDEVDAIVVAIGENFEALLLCTVYLQEMNVKRLIARANDAQQRKILEKLGIEEILSPEDEVGKVVAERLINPSLLSMLQLPDEYEVVEVKAPKKSIGRSLRDIDFRNRYDLNVVTIKRYADSGKEEEKCHVIGVPDAETVISENDNLLLFGKVKNIEKFIEINE